MKKKIYIAPACELLGTANTEVICGSVNIRGKLGDKFEVEWGGQDSDGSHEADANDVVWDHFDNGMQ